MQSHILIAFTLLIGSQTRSTVSTSDQRNLNLCMNNKTVSIQVLSSMNDTACTCTAGPSRDLDVKDDYVYTPGIGLHKLHTNALSWNKARKACMKENAHLAVINSLAEEAVSYYKIIKNYFQNPNQ